MLGQLIRKVQIQKIPFQGQFSRRLGLLLFEALPRGGVLARNGRDRNVCAVAKVNAWRIDPLEVPGAFAKLRFWRNTTGAGLRTNQKAVLLKG